MQGRTSVLFVCLGNICRSPLAEGAFRAECRRRGLEIEIDSAGIGDWHAGQSPDPRACETAKRHGIDIEGHDARQVREKDFFRFDFIYGMDRENFDDLQRLCPPGATAKVAMLLDVMPGHCGQPVPDPYYGGPREFESVWRLVERAARALVDRFVADTADNEMAAVK